MLNVFFGECMKNVGKIFIISLFLLVLTISVVSANENNSTDLIQSDNGMHEVIYQKNDFHKSNQTSEIEKTTPVIDIESTDVKSKDSLNIYLKNSDGMVLKSKNLTVGIGDKNYSYKTNSKGIVTLPITLAEGTYLLAVSFNGDNEYNAVFKNFKINVSKLKTKIDESANFVVKKGYIYFHLVDDSGKSISSKKLTVTFNGKKYTKKTDSQGYIRFKISSPNYIEVKFLGDGHYDSSFRKIYVHSVNSRLINIGNSKLFSNGFLRVYLKFTGKSSSKNLDLYIGGKKLSKKTNSEGIAVFKPSLQPGVYKVKVKVGKYYLSKSIRCFEGNVKDPLKEAIPYKNGKPDIDVMPGNYVMGDDSATYTLTKSQFREVLKRDSYCLFLKNKLTKYTFFKTKNHKINHIIKREKWNVIERAINKELVKKNKKGYWPGKISVSLKGKSYKYPEVRDVQNNGHTCGPASCSMCSQVLKNYVCEKYIAKLSKTNRYGTSCPNMIKALAKNNFIATYFYKGSFNKALKELKKGGCALIFHAKDHYVSILDISKNAKKVLVSNSYGSYDNIPTKWIKVSYMKKKFSPKWTESLIVKLNYKLSNSIKNKINSYYASMGKNWVAQNTHHTIGGNSIY